MTGHEDRGNTEKDPKGHCHGDALMCRDISACTCMDALLVRTLALVVSQRSDFLQMLLGAELHLENLTRVYTLAGGAEPTSHRGDGATHRWDTIRKVSTAAPETPEADRRGGQQVMNVTEPTETGRAKERIARRVREKQKIRPNQG